MKKSLFITMCAAVAFFFSACKSNNGMEPENNGQPSDTEETTINSKVVMRSCNVNGNQWEIMPDYPSQAEVENVMAVIGSQVNPESVAWPSGCTEYFIQHVAGAHKQYYYTDWNGAKHGPIDGTSSQEFFQILEDNGNWQHVYNFNAGKCDNPATHNAALMDNGFNDAKTLNEYASSTIHSWRLFLIDGQYYLGIDFSAKKGDGEIPGDGIYDDWVVKIIPLNGDKPEPDPDPEPDPEEVKGAHVEFDIHQQQHNDWKEIKTSVHLRDTVDFHVLLPIPEVYQAPSDDFAIRGGEMYEYIVKSIQIADKSFDIVFEVTHKAEGIDIFVQGSTLAPALRAARALFQDGLTFEVHTYAKNEVDGVAVEDSFIWDLLKQTEWPTCTPDTHLFGQITSAFYPDERLDYDNQKN